MSEDEWEEFGTEPAPAPSPPPPTATKPAPLQQAPRDAAPASESRGNAAESAAEAHAGTIERDGGGGGALAAGGALVASAAVLPANVAVADAAVPHSRPDSDPATPTEPPAESSQLATDPATLTQPPAESSHPCPERDTSQSNATAETDDGWKALASKLKLQIEKMDDECERLKQQLSARERQIEAQALQLAVLQESANVSQTSKESENRAAQLSAELESLRSEFATRLQAEQKKTAALQKERDALRKLSAMKGNDSDIQERLREKDQQIEGLVSEGTALSKKVGDLEATLKKLRASMKDAEAAHHIERILQTTIERLKKRAEDAEARVDVLQTTNTQLEQERQLLEGSLGAVRDYDGIRGELESTKADLELARQRLVALQTSAELQIKDAEERAREAGQALLAVKLREAGERESALSATVGELRANLAQQAMQAGHREDRLRKEIEELRASCEAAEGRLEELKGTVPDATRPLLRQIETMHAQLAAQKGAADAVERSLTARLQEAEASCAVAAERERAANGRVQDLLLKVAALEANIATSTNEKRRISAEIDSLRGRLDAIMREQSTSNENLSAARAQLLRAQQQAAESETRMRAALVDSQARVETLTRQLEEQSSSAAEEIAGLKKAVEEARTALPSPNPVSSSPTTGHVSQTPEIGSGTTAFFRPVPIGASATSGASAFAAVRPAGAGLATVSGASADHILQRSLAGSPASDLCAAVPFPVSLPSGLPSAAAYERLSANLRQREGEIAGLQTQLTSLVTTRDCLVEELSTLTAQNKLLQDELQQLRETCSSTADLERRYAAALELAGEREEALEELRSDMLELKAIYRDQINELTAKIAALEHK